MTSPVIEESYRRGLVLGVLFIALITGAREGISGLVMNLAGWLRGSVKP